VDPPHHIAIQLFDNQSFDEAKFEVLLNHLNQ
jgi:hypothetical protein